MLSDLIACLSPYYLFFILENHTVIPIDISQPTEEPLDDWEPESEGGVTLPYSTPSPPPTLPSRWSTPETIIHQSPSIDHLDQLAKSYQEYIDSFEQNWWNTKHGPIRHPFPSKRRKTKTYSYQAC